jgi:hypothetical protein
MKFSKFIFYFFVLASAPLLADEEPCAHEPAIGTKCLSGTLYAGKYNGQNYMTTPGGCSYNTNPICDGKMDQISKFWGTFGVLTGINNESDGSQNTTQLLRYGDAAAAAYCALMDFGGYSDWYLPAINELSFIFQNRRVLGGFNSDLVFYWSSTELVWPSAPKAEKEMAKVVWVSGGSVGKVTNDPKNILGGIRCVRTF